MSKNKGNKHNKKNIFGDNNTTTHSFNTYNTIINNNFKCNPSDSINNSNNRTLLKRMVGKQIQIWAYAVDEYGIKYDEETGEEFMMYTIINLHNKDNYIADHIQLKIPYELYDPDIKNKIIWVDGVVYEYVINKKQSIKVEKINISFANDLEIHEDFIRIGRKISNNEAYQIFNKLKNYSPDEKINLLFKYIDVLNNLLLRMPKDFISNYIVNHYTINKNPNSINRSDYSSLINDEDSIIRILFIIVSLIKGLSSGGINSVNMIFMYINWILNSMHGFNEGDIILNKKNREDGYIDVNCVPTNRYPKDFKIFCKDRRIEVDKAFRYIKTRNSNFDGKVLDKSNACKSALEVLYVDLIENYDEMVF